MHTPSFSDSENVSLSSEHCDNEELSVLELECEEKSDEEKQLLTDYENYCEIHGIIPGTIRAVETQTGTTLEMLASRVFRMEDTLRMVYSRVRNTEMICKRNISLILDQSDQHFEKMMMGFRAIQKCWDLSADAQIQMGEAVDQFKELTGVL